MAAPFRLWRISVAGQPTQPIDDSIFAGKNEMYAGHRDGGGFVDRDDAGMGTRRTQHEGVHHAGPLHIVDEMSTSGEEPPVLEPHQRRADSHATMRLMHPFHRNPPP